MVIISSEIRLQIVQIDTSRPLTRYFFSSLPARGTVTHTHPWHQLAHMQVCTSLQTDNHASTPPLSFLQAGCPSCHPTNSVEAP